MTLPAEEPGTPLEPSGNRWPREMVTLDRIRLTGLLRKTLANAGVFYMRLQPRQIFRVARDAASGFSGPLPHGASVEAASSRLSTLSPIPALWRASARA